MAEVATISLTEAANILGETEVTVRRYAREKLIPSLTENGDIVFEREKVDQYKKLKEQFGKR